VLIGSRRVTTWHCRRSACARNTPPPAHLPYPPARQLPPHFLLSCNRLSGIPPTPTILQRQQHDLPGVPFPSQPSRIPPAPSSRRQSPSSSRRGGIAIRAAAQRICRPPPWPLEFRRRCPRGTSAPPPRARCPLHDRSHTRYESKWHNDPDCRTRNLSGLVTDRAWAERFPRVRIFMNVRLADAHLVARERRYGARLEKLVVTSSKHGERGAVGVHGKLLFDG